MVLTRCSMTGNKATPGTGKKSYGGAIYGSISASSPTAPNIVCVNCTIDNNENALHFKDYAKVVLANCTVVNNKNNSIDKRYGLNVEGNATVYVLGSVFFGNQDASGAVNSYQGIVTDSAKVYGDFTIANFSGSGSVSWSSKMGPIPSVLGVSPSKYFYTWSSSLPTIE